MTHFPKGRPLAVFTLLCAAAGLTAPTAATAGDEPYIGEILRVPYTFCPEGSFSAEGQLLSIDEFAPLFSLLGTTFGGDGGQTFALPDLRGRAPLGTGTPPGGQPVGQGQMAGQEAVALNASQLAAHSHLVNATSSDGSFPGPGGKILGAAPPSGVGQETIYSDQAATVTMSPAMISPTGGGAPFAVQDPFVVIRYCVVWNGIFPPRS